MSAPTTTRATTTTVESDTRTGTTEPTRTTVQPGTLTDSATDLLLAMTALPTQHPSRPTLRAKAIEAWLPLANHLAHRYSGRGEPTDDLIQTAAVGLIKAIDKYDPTRGVDFAGYAIPTIIGELKRHFRDRTWDIRVPRRLQELRLAISEANSNLLQTLGRSPTVTDIATHLNLTEEEILEGLEGPAPTTPSPCPPPPATANAPPNSATCSAPTTTNTNSPNSASPSAPPWPPSTNANRKSSPCASTATSPNPRSPTTSASPKCTSPASSPAP
jgi:RNA polymerase sigma factor (sigma-70 family)